MPEATIGGGMADVIEYVDNENCPSRIATVELGYAGGRLTNIGYGPNYAAPVAYDDRGNVVSVAWPEIVEELEYEDGIARGFDLWPGAMLGGPGYGPVPHGELFRLDGSCDPTLTSQAAIATMVIPALLW
jgi:hypothetical protein